MNVLSDVCIFSFRKKNAFSSGDSKIYTSESIANSQRVLTEINESGAIAKVAIWMESDLVKHLKTFRIISSEMSTWLLTLCWWHFSCLRIWIIFCIYFHMSLIFFLIFAPKIYRSVVLKNNRLRTLQFSITNFKFLRGHVLIFQFKSIESEEWEQI